jgi:hypothetical protein
VVAARLEGTAPVGMLQRVCEANLWLPLERPFGRGPFVANSSMAPAVASNPAVVQ